LGGLIALQRPLRAKEPHFHNRQTLGFVLDVLSLPEPLLSEPNEHPKSPRIAVSNCLA
jgi:hypothetical protein